MKTMKPDHAEDSPEHQPQPSLDIDIVSQNRIEKLCIIHAIGKKNPKRSLQYSNNNDSENHLFDNVTKDDTTTIPAVFIAKRLFSDFATFASKKIESILAQEHKDRPIFKSLLKNEDINYDQILEAIGAISEFCLPSLLKISIDWYHHQLIVDGENIQKRSASLGDSQQLLHQNNQSSCECQQSPDCGSPCDDIVTSNTSIIIRSPTPSSPDNTSNQISITSTLPLDYQSPSLTVISESHSSAANTSTSTATNVSSNSLTDDNSTNTIRRLELFKARKLLIEYTFCQVLIEIFNQLYLHPGNDDLIGQIEDIAFDHFRHVEASELNAADLADVNQLADKYAEVIGILAQTRFRSIRKRFMTELNELRAKEPTPHNIQCIVALLSGIKYFRVKMAPIEEFEGSFQFLQELADYFLEVRHKSIKHAMATLFVEIMAPLASTVKNEVKIPCLKNFVDTLWAQTLDMCSRKKHSPTLFPLVTCLLCVSHRSLFLTNWSGFLNTCLSNLKNRDQKMCRIALESLYRLIWIYMIRVKCESNNVTQTRLQSIVDAMFPRNSRTVVPRDIPLHIFVDITLFIAQERLDFAMRHIIFELLSVERPFKVIVAPERMNIALQAFLIIVDSLQQKESEPPLPKTVGIISAHSSASVTAINRASRTHISSNKMLNDDIAKSIGIYQYYSHIQRSFNDILKALDTQYGQPLLLTVSQNSNKEPDDVISGERKPKIDLFKTCLTAIPRLMPEGMSKSELIDLLSRMTVHVDEAMRKSAFESLQILVTDFADWRLDAIEGFTMFLVNHIDESLRNLVDNALKMLLQLLTSWRNAITTTNTANGSGNSGTPLTASNTVSIQTGYETISSRSGGTGGQLAAKKHRALAEMRLIQSELNNTRFDRLVNVIQKVEGASFVMLCSCHPLTRKLAAHMLRECRSILTCYSSWTCMEQLSLKSAEEVDDEDLSASLRGSLSADNISRITATSNGAGYYSSATSMNTQTPQISTSISKVCISSQQQNNLNNNNNNTNQHDLYDSDIDNNLSADWIAGSDNLSLIFWTAVIILDSDNEQEYTFALMLLRKVLPKMPFEQAKFVEQLEENLARLQWVNFPGLHKLVVKGCSSAANYEISIALLDQLTPILKVPICCGASSAKTESIFPLHVIVLLTQLLSNYDNPTPLSLNIARRIAIWCDENSQKLENLSTVMTLYCRKCFSKDGFQWTKCVVKYLYDAYPHCLQAVLPSLVDILERGPAQVQRIIAPILYCIFNYVDLKPSAPIACDQINADLERVYKKQLGSGQWRDAVQIFKLIISRSSQLANSGRPGNARELPGRTMELSMDVETFAVIAKTDLAAATCSPSEALLAEKESA